MCVETCVSNLLFDACHYTPVDGVPTLHGHTFRLSVCVRGELSSSGWVIDFGKLREIVEGVIEPFRYSLIVPSKDKDTINIEGNFRVRVVSIDAPAATGECLGLEICNRVRNKLRDLGFKTSGVSLELWEGSENYVRLSC